MKKKLKLAFSVFCLLSTVYCLITIGKVHAQEAVVIPGPEIKEAGFIQVKDLNIGDVVFVKSETGELVPSTITKLEYQQEPVEVYNLTVEGEETFFANDFAVHNKSGVDTDPPNCRVIVNPTITDVSSLVKNRSFESPIWCGSYKVKEEGEWVKYICALENCPTNWYNRDDGGGHNDQLWCDYGLAVAVNSQIDGNQIVQTGYPNYGGFQVLSGIERFDSRTGGVLYRGSASGEGYAYIGLRNGGRYGNIARASNSYGGWGHGSLLGWDFEAFHLICRNCEEGQGAAFDLVSLEKLYGSTNVSSTNVTLFVAFDDNRNVIYLSHWNQGEPEPEISWTSTDPRVIGFGPDTPRADGIPHTLTGGAGSRTINVRVMDNSENLSEICSATIDYTPPTGTITGNVYQHEWGLCSADGDREALGGWTATCNGIAAEKTGTTSYQCCANWTGGVCNPNLSYVPPGGTSYVVSVTRPADYSITSCSALKWAGSGPYTASVLLNSSSAPAPDLYLWQGAQAWFQTKEGDVHANGGTITSKIFPDNTYFSIFDTGNSPGLVSYNSTTLPNFGKLGLAGVSSKKWLANDSLLLSSGYDSFYSKLGSPTASFDCATNDAYETGFYLANNSPGGQCVITRNRLNFGTNKVVIFVDGDLVFSDSVARMQVDPGGFLAFIVKGNILISGNVGNKTPGSFTGTGNDSNSAHLQGIYIADGIIDTYDPAPVGGGQGSKNRLVVGGLFFARGGFRLEDRNLWNNVGDPITNGDTPAELFIARPDLFINIPEELKTSYFFEQEVAP